MISCLNLEPVWLGCYLSKFGSTPCLLQILKYSILPLIAIHFWLGWWTYEKEAWIHFCTTFLEARFAKSDYRTHLEGCLEWCQVINLLDRIKIGTSKALSNHFQTINLEHNIWSFGWENQLRHAPITFYTVGSKPIFQQTSLRLLWNNVIVYDLGGRGLPLHMQGGNAACHGKDMGEHQRISTFGMKIGVEKRFGNEQPVPTCLLLPLLGMELI